MKFGLETIGHRELKGNYRSTQRIIDLYRQLRPGVPLIESLAEYAKHVGVVTCDNQTVAKEQLPKVIASLIKSSIDSGIPDRDICVLAPRWQHVRPLARSLIAELPHVAFDAPGLSPLYSSRDNVWFKLARLALTEPSSSRSRTRMRWSRELLSDLNGIGGVSVADAAATPRRLLRVINSISSPEVDGIAYLKDAFGQFCVRARINVHECLALKGALATFFEKAASLIARSDGMPTDVESFRRFFSHPAGVVVNTCHGVKGEEFETVIAFGLLRGHIPHWDVIINGPEAVADDRESKLLYVICSRAKRRLHLIAESGRKTQRGRPYETSRLLTMLRFKYDVRR
ncbi:MAG TPA: 3'-5' exonuclease [Bryobacteraceae bacterium]|nr:3'-5' exonuclease [Bryobacteraceae bacterium]